MPVQRRNRFKKQARQYDIFSPLTVAFFHSIKRPVSWLLLTMIVMRVGLRVMYGWLVALDRAGLVDWVLVVLISAIWMYRKRAMKSFWSAAGMIVGTMAVVGILVALVDVIVYQNLWAVVNIIKKPLLFALISLAVSGMVYIQFFNTTTRQSPTDTSTDSDH